ncbi:MAG: carbonic anhydrase [Proteobacteria bacterium]|nr:carbonic anhydrase [Cystobacterineae bacterium]MCL2313817.1 carbonic anhydrase [Pseudomonadota bacterium]
MFKCKLLLILMVFFTISSAFATTPDEALGKLLKGNKQYVSGKFAKPDKKQEEKARAKNVAAGQKPFAAILGCSDSRAPLERMFNVGVGDIFVVRTAGNTAGVDQTASLEFAVDALKVPLVLVLGHTKCGAVAAAVSHAKLPGALGELMSSFKPLTEKTDMLPENSRVSQGEILNVERVVEELGKNEVLAKAISEGKLKVVGGLYHIESGKVTFIGQ